MTSDVKNLVLEQSQAMRADMTEIKLKVGELAGAAFSRRAPRGDVSGHNWFRIPRAKALIVKLRLKK
jgi:hypothetical protein